MKKVLVLAMALLLMLAGCGEPQETEATGGSAQNAGQNTSQSTAGGNQDIQVPDTDPMWEIYRLEILGEWDTTLTEHKETELWLYSVYRKGELGCVHVYQYKGTDRDIVVPDTFDGYPVIAVVDPRMYTLMQYDPDLVSFTRAYDITEITSIQYPDTVYKTYDMLDDTAWFRNQPNGEVYVGNILYKYKGEAAPGTVVNVREGTLSICEMAFYNGRSIEKIILPDSLVWIDDFAFACCEALKEVQMSNNIIGLRNKLFSDCTSLTEIYIPKSLLAATELFENSSITKVYFEGTLSQWKGIFGMFTQQHTFDLETEVPFPY